MRIGRTFFPFRKKEAILETCQLQESKQLQLDAQANCQWKLPGRPWNPGSNVVNLWLSHIAYTVTSDLRIVRNTVPASMTSGMSNCTAHWHKSLHALQLKLRMTQNDRRNPKMSNTSRDKFFWFPRGFLQSKSHFPYYYSIVWTSHLSSWTYKAGLNSIEIQDPQSVRFL